MTKLTELGLTNNQISNIKPLKNLTALTTLGLNSNQISDITSLANLTKLTELGLSDNRISDLKPVTKLIKLAELDISRNPIGKNIEAVSKIASQTKIVAQEAKLLDSEKKKQIDKVEKTDNLYDKCTFDKDGKGKHERLPQTSDTTGILFSLFTGIGVLGGMTMRKSTKAKRANFYTE